MDNITVGLTRYEELLAKEERLCLLERSIKLADYSVDLKNIREIFELNEKGN